MTVKRNGLYKKKNLDIPPVSELPPFLALATEEEREKKNVFI